MKLMLAQHAMLVFGPLIIFQHFARCNEFWRIKNVRFVVNVTLQNTFGEV